MPNPFTVAGWLTFALWVVLVAPSSLYVGRRTLRRVSDRLPPQADWPKVSVVVPARNEGAKIEASLRSLLGLGYPAFEVIAVDDRSDDETGAVMDRVAGEDGRLRVVHVDRLPDGWLGKNHALHVGSERATGEWILFTDGDVLFTGDVIERAVAVAEAERLGLLALLPKMVTSGFLETALVAYFGLLFVAGTQFWLVRTRFTGVYVGIGAFNLVRREAYRAIGGHHPIRLDVLDDVKLAKAIKRHGFRQDVLRGDEGVRVRWQESGWGVVRGLEKNAFAALNYSVPLLVFQTGVLFALAFGPYVAAVALPWPASAGFWATLAFLHAVFAVSAAGMGATPAVTFVMPLAAAGMLLAFWRSAWVTLRRGGVRWRETFYPLELLRKHLY